MIFHCGQTDSNFFADPFLLRSKKNYYFNYTPNLDVALYDAQHVVLLIMQLNILKKRFILVANEQLNGSKVKIFRKV